MTIDEDVLPQLPITTATLPALLNCTATQPLNSSSLVNDSTITIPLSHLQRLELRIAELDKELKESNAEKARRGSIIDQLNSGKDMIRRKTSHIKVKIDKAQGRAKKALKKRVSGFGDRMTEMNLRLGQKEKERVKLQKENILLRRKVDKFEGKETSMADGTEKSRFSEKIQQTNVKVDVALPSRKRKASDEDDNMQESSGKRIKSQDGSNVLEQDFAMLLVDSEQGGNGVVPSERAVKKAIREEVEYAFGDILKDYEEIQRDVEEYQNMDHS